MLVFVMLRVAVVVVVVVVVLRVLLRVVDVFLVVVLCDFVVLSVATLDVTGSEPFLGKKE